MKKLLSLALASFVMLTGCFKSSETLVGKEYKLSGTEQNITIAFSAQDGRYFGQSAVNRYFGTYKIEDNKLVLSPAASTMMAGPQEAMKAEQEYLQNLAKVSTFRLNGKKLILNLGENQDLIFDEIGLVKEEAKK